MKQNNIIRMLLAGAAIMSFASCDNDTISIETEPTKAEKQIVRTETIGVLTESDATKVTLTGTTFSWVDGDQIAVWAGTNATSGSFQDCAVSGGNITVAYGAGEDRYNYAVYPASVKDDSNYGQSVLNVILPATYTYTQVSGDNTPLPMVAVNDKDNSDLTFYNVGGLLRITVKAIPADATGLVFQFPGKKVNGTFAVSDLGTTTPSISNASPADATEQQITVTFGAGTATEMTLNIPLPAGSYDAVNITPVGSSTKVGSYRTIKAGGYTATRARGKQLTATLVSFSVAADKKVIFSPGNLQATYDGSSWSWAFAAHQYDIIGKNAANTSVTSASPWISGTGTVDLFGWVGASADAAYDNFGINVESSSHEEQYGNVSGEALKHDWGYNVINGNPSGTWRTPTGNSGTDEWKYVFDTRTVTNSLSADARYTLATLGSTYQGVILFPDTYTHPAGITISGEPVYNNYSNFIFSVSLDDWAKMEEAGCIFLPAGGSRQGVIVSNLPNGEFGNYGFYWSSTSSQANSAYGMSFRKNSAPSWVNQNRYLGLSIRLVRDL